MIDDGEAVILEDEPIDTYYAIFGSHSVTFGWFDKLDPDLVYDRLEVSWPPSAVEKFITEWRKRHPEPEEK